MTCDVAVLPFQAHANYRTLSITLRKPNPSPNVPPKLCEALLNPILLKGGGGQFPLLRFGCGNEITFNYRDVLYF